MKVYYSDHIVVPLPAGHRFPIGKYRLLRERVAAELVPPVDLHVAPAASEAELALVHTSEYLYKVQTGTLSRPEIRRTGLPWSAELYQRARHSVGGTIAAGRAALAEGIAANLAGGTHHAFPDHGQGFCVFNDVAVAVRALQAKGRIQRAIILDCDVHQGNGTAAIFQDDPTVFTFSIHGSKDFPYRKQASDLDIELPDRTGDQGFLAALETGLTQALDRPADLILYLAGADPFEGDRFGRLALSKTGLAQRDQMVLDACRAAGVPMAVTMAGGYAQPIEETVGIQFQTVNLASESWTQLNEEL